MTEQSIITLGMTMKIKQRQAKLVEIVRKKEKVSVEYLATYLEASRETIRRDLTELTRLGKVQKIHGGATMPRLYGEGSFQQRMSDNIDSKIRIARAAAKLFKPEETLFIDTGSTTLYFAEYLAGIAGLTVITNSFEIARTVSANDTGIRTYLLGGEFGADNHQTVGSMVTAQIKSFRGHHAVLTIGALDVWTGAMDFNIEETQVARSMIEQSRSLTVLVDQTKFNTMASFEVCSLAQIDRLICDGPPPSALADALKAAGVEVIVAS